MFNLFQDTNVAAGVAKNSKFQVGVSDQDTLGLTLERGIFIPWISDPAASWVYYDAVMEWRLDSGIVVHRRLPQVNNTADTLASCDFADANIDTLVKGGVNLASQDDFADVVQRMAHSRFWLHLYGQGMRWGYQVPIPRATQLTDGTLLIPDDTINQIGYNRIVNNYSGVPLWHGVFSSWYTLATPPNVSVAPTAPNIAAHISDKSPLPAAMQAPFSQPDDNATKSAPNLRTFIGAL